jgi:hypothetical protein
VDVEELSQGEDVQPSRLGPIAWLGLALVCLIGGVLLLSGQNDATSADPVATPVQTFSPAPVFPAPKLRVLPTDLADTLSIGKVCPARSDGHSTLVVSFELVNIGISNVTVIDVKPLLPLPGLHPEGRTLAGGSCQRLGTETPAGLMSPDDRRLFTMLFRLPPTCPQASPVQASIRVRVNQMIGTTTVAVFNDLGAVTFDTCPSTNP